MRQDHGKSRATPGVAALRLASAGLRRRALRGGAISGLRWRRSGGGAQALAKMIKSRFDESRICANTPPVGGGDPT
jgi:hypothetical protein